MLKLLPLVLVLILIFSCTNTSTTEESNEAIIEASKIAEHIKVLASDEYGGRMPFTEFETKTIEYLKSQFEEMGVKPGNHESYFQKVPMVEIEAINMSSLKFTGNGYEKEYAYKTDFVALTRRVTESIEITNSEIVFAGYGVVAPEYNWDDYANIDVKGKTVLILVNDPGFGTDDNAFFKGNAMTYYGRWTYKYEEAARQGATGVIIVHDTEPASYPWGVVENGWTGPNLYLKSEDNNMSRCEFEGWISLNTAEELFISAGKEDYDFRKSVV